MLTESGREIGSGSGCAHATGVGSEVEVEILLNKRVSAKTDGFFLGLDDAELGLDLVLDFDLLRPLQKEGMA